MVGTIDGFFNGTEKQQPSTNNSGACERSCLYTGHSENTLSVEGKRVSRRGRGLLALDIVVA